MSVGYVVGRMGWMTSQEKKFISKFLINIAVPCNCITGILNNLNREDLGKAGVMLVAAYLTIISCLLISLVVTRLLRLPRERRGVFTAMTAFSNTMFIGIPVCKQLFGDACMGYLMIYYLASTTFVQSVAFLLVESSGTKSGMKPTPASVAKSVFTKPPIVMLIISLLLLVLGLRPPEPLMSFASYISGTVSPLALLYCGYIIYEVGLRNIRLLPGLPVMLVMRLGLSPVLCYGICRLFQMEGLALSVFVVESALPVVSQVTVAAGEYGADEKYSATGATLSTLCSFITIPILMVLLG